MPRPRASVDRAPAPTGPEPRRAPGNLAPSGPSASTEARDRSGRRAEPASRTSAPRPRSRRRHPARAKRGPRPRRPPPGGPGPSRRWPHPARRRGPSPSARSLTQADEPLEECRGRAGLRGQRLERQATDRLRPPRDRQSSARSRARAACSASATRAGAVPPMTSQAASAPSIEAAARIASPIPGSSARAGRRRRRRWPRAPARSSRRRPRRARRRPSRPGPRASRRRGGRHGTGRPRRTRRRRRPWRSCSPRPRPRASAPRRRPWSRASRPCTPSDAS